MIDDIPLLTRTDALLKDKDSGVSIRLGDLDPEHITEMRAMVRMKGDGESSIALYALRTCISELTVNGKEFQPKVVSRKVNPVEKNGAHLLTVVATLVINAVLVSDEIRKKLNSPPSPGGQINAVAHAPASDEQADATEQTSTSTD